METKKGGHLLEPAFFNSFFEEVLLLKLSLDKFRKLGAFQRQIYHETFNPEYKTDNRVLQIACIH